MGGWGVWTLDSELRTPNCRVSGAAQSPQNLARGGFSNPHWGQRFCRGAAHSVQNFIPSGLSNPQLGQCMPPPSVPDWTLLYHGSVEKQRNAFPLHALLPLNHRVIGSLAEALKFVRSATAAAWVKSAGAPPVCRKTTVSAAPISPLRIRSISPAIALPV